MLKKTLFVALCLVMAFSMTAFAGEGSDTVGGGKLLPQLRYGYSTMDWSTDSANAGNFDDWKFSSHNYYAQLNWGVFNNVDLIALVGGRSLCTETEFTTVGVGTLKGKGDGTAFLWGLGVKGTFFRADNGFYVGGGALFTHSFTDDFDFSQSLNGGPATEFDFDYSVYQLVPEIHAGWHLKNIGLTPYLGVDYTWARALSEYSTNNQIEWRPEHPVAMFAGVDYFLNDKLYVNVEGRTNFIDGWGVETGVGYLFDICATPPPPPPPPPVIEPKLEPMSKN